MLFLFSIPYMPIKVEPIWDKSLHCKQIAGLDELAEYCLASSCRDIYVANHLVTQKDSSITVIKYICWE